MWPYIDVRTLSAVDLVTAVIPSQTGNSASNIGVESHVAGLNYEVTPGQNPQTQIFLQTLRTRLNSDCFTVCP